MKLPPAVGDPSPVWPLELAGPRRVTGDIGACRPSGGPCVRHHEGEDLPAPRGTFILAPETGHIVTARDKWFRGTGIVVLATLSGISLILGEVEPGSFRELGVDAGSLVTKGQRVARVGWHKMLHFEAYAGLVRESGEWPWGKPPPRGLLDPTDYLRRAAGSPAPIVEPEEPEPIPRPTPTRPPSSRPSSSAAPLVLLALLAAGAA